MALAGLAYAALSGSLYILRVYPRHRAESAWFVCGVLFLVLLSVHARAMLVSRDAPAVSRASPWLFLAAACVLYIPSFAIGRLSDDFVLLSASARWDLVPAAWEHLRPLPLAVWGVLTAAGLGAPAVLHATNILLHGLNAYFVRRLGAEVGLDDHGSLAAALLFLVFPGSVETVTWISGMQDVLMTTCVLGFLLASLSGRFAVATLLLIAGTATKETAVSAPLLLLFVRTLRPVPLRFILLGFVWVTVFALLRLTISPADDFTQLPSRYVLKEFLSRLFGGLALPWTQPQIAQAPYLALAGVAGLVGLLAVELLRRANAARHRALLVLAGWCVTAAAPVYLYLFIGPELEGSRYLYLPSVGWVLLLSLLGLHTSGQRVRRGALLLLMALGVYGSLLQQFRWRAAATYRDQVLLQVDTATRAAGCAAPFFVGGPATLNGAYVLGNGMNEAFAERRASPASLAADCRLAWAGGQFVPE